MINVADELHAATEQGIIASSSEISIPNSEETVAEALARQQEEIDELEEGMPDDYAKEETVGNFRSALMGANGILRLRPLYGARGALIQDTQDTTHHIIVRHETNENELGEYGLQKEIEGGESYGYTLPEEGAKYSFPFGAKSGIELMEPSFGGASHFYVPTTAPANIITQSGFNFEACGLVEITEGMSITFVKEVKYYNHTNEQTQETETVKDDDESGIDYATTEGYVYVCSLYVYSTSETPSEISLADIKQDTNILNDRTHGLAAIKTAIATLAANKTLAELQASMQGSTGNHTLLEIYTLLTSNDNGLAALKTYLTTTIYTYLTDTINANMAKDSSVKDGNDTAIGLLKDQNNGLAAIKSALANLTVSLTQADLAYLASQITGLNLSSQQISDLGSAIATAIGSVTATLTSSQIADIVSAIENGVTLSQLNTTIGNAAAASQQAATNAGQAAQNANSAAEEASQAAAAAAQAAAAIEGLVTETELTALPSTAVINIEQPEQSSGAVVLTIAPDIEYTLGDLTSLSLVLSAPASDNRYHDYAVRFRAIADFQVQVTHYDQQHTIQFLYSAQCKTGHYYLLSIYDDKAFMAEF